MAPLITPVAENRTSVYLPKRDELLFIPVLALPKASNSGLTLSEQCVQKNKGSDVKRLGDIERRRRNISGWKEKLCKIIIFKKLVARCKLHTIFCTWTSLRSRPSVSAPWLTKMSCLTKSFAPSVLPAPLSPLITHT